MKLESNNLIGELTDRHSNDCQHRLHPSTKPAILSVPPNNATISR